MPVSNRIEQNMHIVDYVIDKFYNGGEAFARYHQVEVEDLYQIGRIGLVKADRQFDPDRAVQFFTYAVHKIRGEIRRFKKDTNLSARFPRTIKEVAARLEDIESLSLRDIMERTGISHLDALGVIDYAKRKPISLQQVMTSESESGDTISLEDMIPSRFDTAEEALRNVEFEERMALLNVKTKKVCRLILSGLDQSATSKRIGISQSRISRHLSNAVKTIEKEYDTC